MSEPRQCVVRTAQHWFDSARKAKEAGRMQEALMCMENAFNHTENALVTVVRVATFKDQPPVSGRPKMTLTEMRAELDAMGGGPG